jgi:glycosyltransferase involved in cell wall biosynthesis
MGVITNPFILKAMDILEWVSYKTAKRCIGLSPGIVDGIKRRGIDSRNVAMIPNGCDLQLFDPATFDALRPEGINKNDFVALFSGAHGLANGLDAVLDAAIELKSRKREDIKLLLIGDGKLKPALKLRAETEALDNCIFLDPVPKRDLARLLSGVDAGMMILANVPAFYYGTSPNKFFDYIASGLPVIINYPGWLAELIDQNNCGAVVPPENPKAFADTLEHLADNHKEVIVMGKKARRLAELEFDRRKLADEFVDWLGEVATR